MGGWMKWIDDFVTLLEQYEECTVMEDITVLISYVMSL